MKKIDFSRLTAVKGPCYWHDITCEAGWECDTCGHQPPDDEKSNGKEPPKRPIFWEESYGVYPMCPSCGETTYSMDRCIFCGQKLIKDDRTREREQPPEIKRMNCFSCGGKGTFEYTRVRSNGHMHGCCTACGASIIE